MKFDLLRILILVIVAILLTTIVEGQSLKDRFIKQYETKEFDPNFDRAEFKWYGYVYDDVDELTSQIKPEIFIYLGGYEVRFLEHRDKYKLPPNLREEHYEKLKTYPVDSVAYWDVFRPDQRKNKFLFSFIPDDPNYFIENLK